MGVASSVVDADRKGTQDRWIRTYGLVLFVCLGIVFLYWDAVESMVSIWIRSDTFAHGFLIVPISLWLVWERRGALRGLEATGSWIPLLGTIPVGVLWLLGYVVDVIVVQQFAFVAMMLLGIWAVIGDRLARLLAFPLGFLFFAIPVGEGLIYPMMNFTADFTVTMLRVTGIEVFRDGTFFSLPTGDWSVVEACSGVRYLIASATLGTIYAYLTYTKLWKRLVFCLFAVVVPVLANGMRAYMIVMIGHLSGMKYAVGVDHLIYGWLFFGIVIAVMFVVGSFWRDPIIDTPSPESGKGDPAVPRFGGWAAAVFVLAAAAAWPALAWYVDFGAGAQAEVRLKIPEEVEGWTLMRGSPWDWRPHVLNTDGQSYHFYRGADGIVGLYLGVYADQNAGSELVNSQNQMVLQQHPMWSEKERIQRVVDDAGKHFVVEQSRLARVSGERLLIWSWYRVGGDDSSDVYRTKLREALLRFSESRRDGAIIALATPYTEKEADAESVLIHFLGDVGSAIRRVVDGAVQVP